MASCREALRTTTVCARARSSQKNSTCGAASVQTGASTDYRAVASTIAIPYDRLTMSLRSTVRFVVRDFSDFVLHQKKWWLTMLVIIISIFVAVVLLTEPRGVRPMIYSNY